MKSIVDMSMSRRLMHAAMYGDASGGENGGQTASPTGVEAWAGRVMWLLVVATSLWDIAVTFDRHIELTARLF